VCQGYHGQITHQDVLAFDLTVESSAGNDGCWGDQDASTGQLVFSPVTGTAERKGPDKEFVCVTRASGGSLLIGHLDPGSRIKDGSQVTAGVTMLGSLRGSSPDTAQGGYAHIHIEAHARAHCAGDSVAFTANKGFRFKGSPDFANKGEPNQWSGSQLVR
jgi:hypothetical protein